MSKASRGLLTARNSPLLQHLAICLALGASVGLTFAVGVMTSDAFGLGSMIEAASNPLLLKALLCVMNMLTFGSLGMAAGIMALPLEEPPRDSRDE